MATVDYEAAWLALKSNVVGREGIGTGRLLALMGELEVQHRFDEEVVERLLRRYGVSVGEDLRALTRDEPGTEPSTRDAAGPRASKESGPTHREGQEIHDEQYRSGAPGRRAAASLA